MSFQIRCVMLTPEEVALRPVYQMLPGYEQPDKLSRINLDTHIEEKTDLGLVLTRAIIDRSIVYPIKIQVLQTEVAPERVSSLFTTHFSAIRPNASSEFFIFLSNLFKEMPLCHVLFFVYDTEKRKALSGVRSMMSLFRPSGREVDRQWDVIHYDNQPEAVVSQIKSSFIQIDVSSNVNHVGKSLLTAIIHEALEKNGYTNIHVACENLGYYEEGSRVFARSHIENFGKADDKGMLNEEQVCTSKEMQAIPILLNDANLRPKEPYVPTLQDLKNAQR